MAEEVVAVDQPKLNPITQRPWTDEERAAASARAKAQVAKGTFGGSNNGRRKKVPAYARIAAEAQRNAGMLSRELLKIASSGDTQKLQLDAIKLLVEIELKAKANTRDEQDHLRKLPPEELQAMLIERISEITGDSYDIELGEGDYSEGPDDDEE
jgi:hypothetical protein